RFYHAPPKFTGPCSGFNAPSESDFPVPHHFRTIHEQSNNGELVDSFDRLLQLCVGGVDRSYNVERPVKQIHSQIALTSSNVSPFLSARLVAVYAKLSLLIDARKVFDTCFQECLFSSLLWNSILRAYACAMKGDVRLCEVVHSHVTQMGLVRNLHVGNELVGMYGEIGWTKIASNVFDQMPLRSIVTWNIMISVFAKSNDCDSAFRVFSRMENDGWVPNSVTWTSLVSSFSRCGHIDKTWEFYVRMREKGVDITAESVAVVISACDEIPVKGKIVHGHVARAGFENYVFVRNALISMYGKMGAVENAENLFAGLEFKSIISWNALISAYAQSGFCDEAYNAFFRLKSLDGNSLVRPNVITWTAVINAFAGTEHNKEMTLEIFRQMQFSGVFANAVTVGGVLSACAELSALSLGQEIHAHAVRKFMAHDTLVANGLINMYMKCGNLKTGNLIFEQMLSRDVTSWNIMITGFGMHGLGITAVNFFNQMVNSNFNPDEITFVAVLSGCSHSGLVSEGKRLFNLMVKEFRIEPKVEHYSCMVDLLGRAGLLQEAGEILRSMPMEPNAPVWGALLNSCKLHKNMDFAKKTASRFFGHGRVGTGGYMLLSNLYASSGMWDESANVRMRARTRGLKKVPGQSWIEVKKKVRTFSAGKALESDVGELYEVLEDLNLHMVVEGKTCDGFFEQGEE
ncbi:pentatricopeptide repeat-containing protein, partial [Striga asiatica]